MMKSTQTGQKLVSLKDSETVLFGRVPPVTMFFNDYGSCTYILTQVRAPYLKVSSHSNHICRSRRGGVTKNWTKTYFNWPY